MHGDVDAGQEPTHGVANEMKGAIDAIGKGLDGGMNVLRQRLERLAAARIIQVEGSKSGAFQRQLHLSKR